jgi:GrpB-like predicted nucleotidyltransferase (UPF0157 family)
MIEIATYDPEWPLAFLDEAAHLRDLLPVLRDLEHVGSTAVPGLAAKPVIDMMGTVDRLDNLMPHLPTLAGRGYAPLETGMRGRLFLQRPGFNMS